MPVTKVFSTGEARQPVDSGSFMLGSETLDSETLDPDMLDSDTLDSDTLGSDTLGSDTLGSKQVRDRLLPVQFKVGIGVGLFWSKSVLACGGHCKVGNS